jgi:hypothetical protein
MSPQPIPKPVRIHSIQVVNLMAPLSPNSILSSDPRSQSEDVQVPGATHECRLREGFHVVYPFRVLSYIATETPNLQPASLDAGVADGL